MNSTTAAIMLFTILGCNSWMISIGSNRRNLKPTRNANISLRNDKLETTECDLVKLPSHPSYPGAFMFMIHNRKCLFLPSRNPSHRNIFGLDHHYDDSLAELSSSSTLSCPPPIIVLGGMAQTIDSWQLHLNDFSKNRDVLIYEYLGQGMGNPSLELDQDNSSFNNMSMDLHSKDFHRISTTLFPECNQLDVIAFSLGARIILSTIAMYPNLIRKVHLTGVSAERDDYGKVVLHSWKDLLGPKSDHDDQSKDLRPFAWSILFSTYSNDFISKIQIEKIESWVDFICTHNTRAGLFALISYCDDDPINFANKIRAESSSVGKIALGSQDKIAPLHKCQQLRDALGWEDDIQIYNGSGHAVLNESHARQWRQDALRFLEDNT